MKKVYKFKNEINLDHFFLDNNFDYEPEESFFTYKSGRQNFHQYPLNSNFNAFGIILFFLSK